MNDIEKRLFAERHMTPNALRFQRTGCKTYGKAMEMPYTWNWKTLYDMLSRREYLGHTYTSKTHKVSYKVRKTVKHAPEDHLEFLNTHEALISEDVFAIAQKRVSERNRPCKSDEIDIFSGLLFCPDCGKRMYVQRGPSIPERKYAYLCGSYRNNTGGVRCSTHYIRQSVITELVLADVQRVCRYIVEHKAAFLKKAQADFSRELEKTTAKARQEYQRGKTRLTELDTIFRRLYEDQVFGKISEAQFVAMTTNYDEERETLAARLAELERLLKESDALKNNAVAFVKIVEKHGNTAELSFELLHELVDRIYVHEVDKIACTRKIEIIYNYVGNVDSDGEKPESEAYFRQGVGNGACLIKSIVI